MEAHSAKTGAARRSGLAAIRAGLSMLALALVGLLPADALARAGGGSHSFSSGGSSRLFGRSGGGLGGGHHFFFFGGGFGGGGGGFLLLVILIVVGYLIYRAYRKSQDRE